MVKKISKRAAMAALVLVCSVAQGATKATLSRAEIADQLVNQSEKFKENSGELADVRQRIQELESKPGTKKELADLYNRLEALEGTSSFLPAQGSKPLAPSFQGLGLVGGLDYALPEDKVKPVAPAIRRETISGDAEVLIQPPASGATLVNLELEGANLVESPPQSPVLSAVPQEGPAQAQQSSNSFPAWLPPVSGAHSYSPPSPPAGGWLVTTRRGVKKRGGRLPVGAPDFSSFPVPGPWEKRGATPYSAMTSFMMPARRGVTDGRAPRHTSSQDPRQLAQDWK